MRCALRLDSHHAESIKTAAVMLGCICLTLVWMPPIAWSQRLQRRRCSSALCFPTRRCCSSRSSRTSQRHTDKLQRCSTPSTCRRKLRRQDSHRLRSWLRSLTAFADRSTVVILQTLRATLEHKTCAPSDLLSSRAQTVVYIADGGHLLVVIARGYRWLQSWQSPTAQWASKPADVAEMQKLCKQIQRLRSHEGAILRVCKTSVIPVRSYTGISGSRPLS